MVAEEVVAEEVVEVVAEEVVEEVEVVAVCRRRPIQTLVSVVAGCWV